VPAAEPPKPYPAAYPGPAVAAPAGIQPAASPPAVVAYREENGGPAPAAPATRRFARELGVDLNRVRGTGPGGRISREDIIAAVRQVNQAGVATATVPAAPANVARDRGLAPTQGVEGQDNFGPVRREPLSSIRKAIAANMARSNATIPHVTNFDDADITELEKIRKGSMADYVDKNVKLTMMAFVLKAVAHSLKLHPAINATLDLEAGEVVYKQYVNLGVAVDTDRGLVVPVMRGVDRLTIPQIAQALMTLANKARQNQFSLDDMKGGTFTISNLGAIGGTYSTPIINHPEVAILLVGRSRKLPVVIDDQIKPRLMMPLSLSYDHRWIDGATAARFLNEVKGFLEAPGRLLLAP
jgi:pyruvate dehydrogenase E2 component (dihydrolipoamide acetyltransferase)